MLEEKKKNSHTSEREMWNRAVFRKCLSIGQRSAAAAGRGGFGGRGARDGTQAERLRQEKSGEESINDEQKI